MPELDQPHRTEATLGEVADFVRAKNAGPFWVTLDVFLSPAAYAEVTASGAVTAATVAHAYHVDATTVKIFQLPDLHVLKVSFPRRHPQASLRDRDVHSGQQHIPLQQLKVTRSARAS